MSVAIAITKTSAQGEQIVYHITAHNPVTGENEYTFNELDGLINKYMTQADNRMQEMNLRVLEAYELLDMLPMEQQQAFHSLLDVIAGRTAAATVKHRWDSMKEETEELEKGRELALKNGKDE